MKLTCEAPDCDRCFEPKRSTARFCSATCRQRAARARKAAEAQAREEAKTDTPAEHDLVRAVRLELEKADAVMTVPGQVALQLARKMANPDESGLSALAKELRVVLAEATGAMTPVPAGEVEPEDDEVTKARRAREEAREAAGLA